jgi:polyhydroxybutyrate depolymerase
MPTRWNRRVILILVLAAMPLACTNATPTAATVATTAGTSATPTAGTPQPAGTVATQPAGTGKSRAGQSFVISLSSGGTQRTALLHVPTGYSSATAVPLIVNFHGKGETGKDQEALSGMSGLADQAGFLVAYPNGIDGQWNDASGSASAADRQFVRDLVTKLRADYTVDPKRIYAAGMSNGGGMTNRVGCDLADVFAAIAPVEGGYSDWEGSAVQGRAGQ